MKDATAIDATDLLRIWSTGAVLELLCSLLECHWFPTRLTVTMLRVQELRIALEVYRRKVSEVKVEEGDPTTSSHTSYTMTSNGEGTLGELMKRALEQDQEATKDLICLEGNEANADKWELESAVNVTSGGHRLRRSTLYYTPLADIVAGDPIRMQSCAVVCSPE